MADSTCSTPPAGSSTNTSSSLTTGEAASSSFTLHITLEMFQDALERQLEDLKPDPLAFRQVQNWQLEWMPEQQQRQRHDEQAATEVSCSSSSSSSGALIGSLAIQDKHVIVTLHSHCTWPWPSSSSSSSLSLLDDSRTLDFVLRAQARFASSSTTHSNGSSGSNSSRKKHKKDAESKIRTRIMKRLREDDYVKPLLVVEEEESRSPSEHGRGPVLCEAHIHWVPGSSSNSSGGGSDGNGLLLEERVHVNQVVAEGVRRCIYSQSSNTLDLMLILLRLPYLPSNRGSLAQRARLRLLEDVMVDACQDEADSDLLQDLSLQPQEDTDDEYTTTTKTTPKRKKRR